MSASPSYRWPLQRRLLAVVLTVVTVALFATVAGFMAVSRIAGGQALHDRLVLVWAGGILLILLGTTLLTTHLVRLGLRPLTDIAATADRIEAGDLSVRLPDAGRDEVGQVAAALNTMLDRVEAALADRQAADDRLRRFVQDAGHELHTPVTAIRGWADLHRGGGIAPSEVATAMRRIGDEATRIGVLVDQLLLLASLDRPAEDPGTEGGSFHRPVDLAEIVRDAALDARVVEPGRPVTTDVPEPGIAVVHGDPIALQQVVANLLGNVRVHTPAGTPARVQVLRVADGDGDCVVLRVVDDGPGVSADVRDKLFDRFFRAGPGGARHRDGAGLGLSIVAAIIAGHGGNIRVEPSTTGFAMRISLPAAAKP